MKQMKNEQTKWNPHTHTLTHSFQFYITYVTVLHCDSARLLCYILCIYGWYECKFRGFRALALGPWINVVVVLWMCIHGIYMCGTLFWNDKWLCHTAFASAFPLNVLKMATSRDTQNVTHWNGLAPSLVCIYVGFLFMSLFSLSMPLRPPLTF